MAFSWEAVISGAISGGAIGALASLFAPWSQWGVERRRLLYQDRKSRIKNWRDTVLTASLHISDNDPFRIKLKRLNSYRDIRQHLTLGLANEIETEWPEGQVQDEDELKDMILDEINSVEKEWELI